MTPTRNTPFRARAWTTTIACVALAAGPAAQPRPGPTVDWSRVENRIAWFGTLGQARAVAAATHRPILLVAAAPHCGGVPGVW